MQFRKSKRHVLTYNGEVISEAGGLCVAEVDAAAVDAFVAALDVAHQQRGGRGRHREVGARPEHLRRRPVPRLRQVLAADVEAVTTGKYMLEKK